MDVSEILKEKLKESFLEIKETCNSSEKMAVNFILSIFKGKNQLNLAKNELKTQKIQTEHLLLRKTKLNNQT